MKTNPFLFFALVQTMLITNSVKAQSNHPLPKFDVIDSSFLFPIEEGRRFPLKRILKENLFNELNHFIRTEGSNSFEETVIVGWRFNPCFPRITARKCNPQLRFQAQFIDKKGVTTDASVDIIYAVEDSDVPRIVQTLADIKMRSPAPTNGVALGVHPGLKDKEFANFVYDKIDALVGDRDPSLFVEIVRSTSKAKRAEWTMSAYTTEDNHLKKLDIPHIKKAGVKDHKLSLHTGKNTFSRTNVSPKTSLPSIRPLYKLLNNRGEPTQKQLDALLETENPLIRTIGNMDCMSCHAATVARGQLEKRGFKEADIKSDYEFFVAKGGPTTKMLESYKRVYQDNLVLINFGYYFNEPVVSKRTINESVAITLFLNNWF